VDRRQRLKGLKPNPCKTAANAGPNHHPLTPVHPVGLPREAPTKRRARRGPYEWDESASGYLFSDVPAERRSSQASTTRLLMPASASFPQARGSYAFLLPTSPSTFSTPS
jgi:hypothetical protein